MEIVIILLSVSTLALILSLAGLFARYTILQGNLKKSEEILKTIRSFVPGSKALLHDFVLKNHEDNFTVHYQVEVIEVSDKKIKVNAYDFTSPDPIGKDPSMRNSIIGFMQNFWISKSQAELVMDQSDIREVKINKLLS